jgi:hypothetical protein
MHSMASMKTQTTSPALANALSNARLATGKYVTNLPAAKAAGYSIITKMKSGHAGAVTVASTDARASTAAEYKCSGEAAKRYSVARALLVSAGAQDSGLA